MLHADLKIVVYKNYILVVLMDKIIIETFCIIHDVSLCCNVFKHSKDQVLNCSKVESQHHIKLHPVDAPALWLTPTSACIICGEGARPRPGRVRHVHGHGTRQGDT